MAITAADVETDQIAPCERALRRLHVAERAASAKADATGHRRGVVLREANVEGPQHFLFGDALARNLESGIDCALSVARCLSQDFDFACSLDRAHALEQRERAREGRLRHDRFELIHALRRDPHFVEADLCSREAPLLHGGSKSLDRTLKWGACKQLLLHLVGGIKLCRWIDIDLEITVAVDLLYPEILVGHEIQKSGIGNDASFAIPGLQYIGLGSAPHPLRHGP